MPWLGIEITTQHPNHWAIVIYWQPMQRKLVVYASQNEKKTSMVEMNGIYNTRDNLYIFYLDTFRLSQVWFILAY